ncbi:MAG: class I SAM-dependent RNA methyltransferase [Candidatus Contendobacter sp.]
MSLPVGCEPRCPGCTQRMLSAEASAAQKTDWLQRTLAPWAACLVPLRAVAGAARWSYRGKVCLSALWHEQNGWNFGLWRRDALIAIPNCPVHTEAVRLVTRWLMRTLPPGPTFPLAFYVQSGAQATLILKTQRLPDASWLQQQGLAELAAYRLEGLWLHLHPAAGRRLFARSGWTLLWGQPRSVDSCGLWYGPTAFQQLIPTLYQLALDTAEEFLAPELGDQVADLYCGIGASLARWTRRGARALGVELGGEAVECAAVNAPAALVLRGKCAERVPQLRTWSLATGTRLLYLNPPRTGLELAVRTWAATEFRPERLAYLSCSAGTLSRDLHALTQEGYQVERLIPFDFFPQTHHVETLALLRRA